LAISKEKKEAIITDLTEKFSRSQAIILTDYRGLSVAEISRLRHQLREMTTGYHVVKNRLVKLALAKAGLPVPEDLLQGPTAMAFCYEDVAASAKAVMDFARESRILTIKGGVLSDRVITTKQVSALATLPSVDVLRAQVLAGIQSPMAGLLDVLSGPLRQLVYVLQARAQQLEGATS
jgi:large subunit ribosomal protein L10